MAKHNQKGVGCGVFLVLLGVGLIAQRMGWFRLDTVWLLPAALIAVGLAQIFDALRG